MTALSKDKLGFVRRSHAEPKKVLRQDQFGFIRLYPADKGKDLPIRHKYSAEEGQELDKIASEYASLLESMSQ